MKHEPSLLHKRILIVDTSSRPGRFGILGEKLIWHPLKSSSTEKELIPAIREALKAQGFSFEDFVGFASVKSGQSFTGLRIGAVVANVLAWTTGSAAVGVSATDSPKKIRALVEGASKDSRVTIVYNSV